MLMVTWQIRCVRSSWRSRPPHQTVAVVTLSVWQTSKQYEEEEAGRQQCGHCSTYMRPYNCHQAVFSSVQHQRRHGGKHICVLKWSVGEDYKASGNPNFLFPHDPWVGCLLCVIFGLRRMKQTGLLIWFGFRLCLCNIWLVILPSNQTRWLNL